VAKAPVKSRPARGGGQRAPDPGLTPESRTRAAAGFTLILLAGLGFLILAQSRSPSTDIPPFAEFPRGQIMDEGSERLFEFPEAALATAEAGFALSDNQPVRYLLYIPRLQRYAPVVTIHNELVQLGGQEVWQLSLPPAYAAGWSEASAPIGEMGNSVFVGHNNEYGEVFRGLEELEAGDEVYVRSPQADHLYRVTETALFEEQYLSLDERLDNARWLAPTPDERLTLITCWPYFSNTHRVVVVAQPTSQ
jgi:LPXTG-site transpeptidase (sortase) family protein